MRRKGQTMSYYYNKEVYIKRKIAEEKLKKIAPNLETKPAIYTWYRYAEIKAYIGQAKGGRLKDRSIEHIIAYDHLGNSIRTHGLYSQDNPFGWRLKVEYCNEEDLNRLEREKIAQAQELGLSLYNITSGGQDKGKEDINQRASGKSYRDGIKQGYKNCLNEIKELFDNYLDFVIKPSCVKKNGEFTEVAKRKLNEFAEMLKEKNDEN